MATATKKNTKKPAAKSKGSKKVVAGKRSKFNLSSLQKKLLIGTGVVLVAAGGYFGYMAYQDSQANAASCTSNTYKQGSSGSCVKYMQQIINASGTTSKITTDGAFGSGTKKAVTDFQKAKKLTADGKVGDATWKALCKVTGSAATAPKKSVGCSSSTGSNSTPKPSSPAPQVKKGWTDVGSASIGGGQYDLRATYTVKMCKTSSNYVKVQVSRKSYKNGTLANSNTSKTRVKIGIFTQTGRSSTYLLQTTRGSIASTTSYEGTAERSSSDSDSVKVDFAPYYEPKPSYSSGDAGSTSERKVSDLLVCS